MPPTRTTPRRRVLALVFAAGAGPIVACNGGAAGECTSTGECSSLTQVSFDAPISGPYTMLLETDSGAVELRCNAPGDMATEDNPEWATCDAAGFEVEGDEATLSSSLTVSIYVDELDDYYVIGEIVDLTITATLEPNGVGCEPICFERSGSLLGPA